MAKYLIIGGAGFIGSALADGLLIKGNEVVILDNLSAKPLNKINVGNKMYKVDIDNENIVLDIFKKEKPDFVYHLAGVINLRKSVTDALFLKDLNFLKRTKIILNACKESNIKKIIFVSSGGAIYENAKNVPTSESYLASPKSLYGLANLMIEKYIQLYYQNFNLNYTIARLSNVYGPGQWESGIVPSIIISLFKKERPIIFGNGKQTRDFVYIEDVVSALVILAKSGKNEIYNIGIGKEITLNKIIELIKSALSSKIPAKYEKSKNSGGKRSALNISKIKKDLNWKPVVSFDQGIKKTIDFYVKYKFK